MEVEGSIYDNPIELDINDKSTKDNDSNNNNDEVESNEDSYQLVEGEDEEVEVNYYSTVAVNHSPETVQEGHSTETVEEIRSSETVEVNNITESVYITTTVTTTTDHHSDARSISSHGSEEHRTLQEINQVLDNNEDDVDRSVVAAPAQFKSDGGSEVDLDELVKGNVEQQPLELYTGELVEEGLNNYDEAQPMSFAAGGEVLGRDQRGETYDDYENISEVRAGSENDGYDDVHAETTRSVSVTSNNENIVNAPPSYDSVGPATNVPASSGKFVMRSVQRADPLHVVRRITQNEKSTHQPNPELDELVTIIKSNQNDTASNPTRTIMKQKIQSWLTTPLVNQFNKDSETGGEAGVFPKGVGPTGSQSSYLTIQSQARTSVTDQSQPRTSVTDQSQARTSVTDVAEVNVKQQEIVIQTATTVVRKDSVDIKVNGKAEETSAFSLDTDEKRRSNEIAKAIEAASFKPAATATQPTPVPRNKTEKVTEEKTVIVSKPATNGVGVSMYSKPAVVQTQTSKTTRTATSVSSADNIKLSTVVETLVPSWKAEVERRKQTKDYVVYQKPEQPLRLADMPDWKKQLQEKNKTRKPSTDAEPTSAVVRDNGDLEWKAEIKHILRQKSAAEIEDIPLREKPEWERLADGNK